MSHKKVQKINKMYKCEKVENYIVIYNEKQKFKVLDFNEPNQIKIVDITYGNKTNGGYWANINDYCDEFISQIIKTHLYKINNKGNLKGVVNMASMVPYRSVFGVRPSASSLFDLFDDMTDLANNSISNWKWRSS